MGSKAVTCTGVKDEGVCEATGEDVADCGCVLAEDARRLFTDSRNAHWLLCPNTSVPLDAAASADALAFCIA